VFRTGGGRIKGPDYIDRVELEQTRDTLSLRRDVTFWEWPALPFVVSWPTFYTQIWKKDLCFKEYLDWTDLVLLEERL
jgi:hypothetical protein